MVDGIIIGTVVASVFMTALYIRLYLPTLVEILAVLKESRDLLKKATAHLED